MSSAHSNLRIHSEILEDWLFGTALPLWWERGGDREGGFHEVLALDGVPVIRDRRARVQARQSYVYALAGTMGWQGAWQEPAQHGLLYLMQRYRKPDGEFATLASAEGRVLDETAMLYDQAFVLLAMATLHAALPGRGALEDEALGLARKVTGARRHGRGGYAESGSPRFQSNPHMHLFEASLAWCEAGPAPFWQELADEIGGLALGHFIDRDAGYLREFFREDWTPMEGAEGRIVEPGHQFEWAWLLERWGRARNRGDARIAARRLFACGMHGIDRARNVAVDELAEDLSIARATARLWPQTERLKAALILAESEQGAARENYLSEAGEAARSLLVYLDTPTKGLWRDKMREDGSFVEEPAPASSFYHIVCAIDALRATARHL